MLACKTIGFLAQHGWNTTNMLNNTCMSESEEVSALGKTLTMEISKNQDGKVGKGHPHLQVTQEMNVSKVADFFTGYIYVGDNLEYFRFQFDTSSDWSYLYEGSMIATIS